VNHVFIPQGRKIKRLIGDRAYDSEALRERFEQMEIDLICPHRRNRKRPKLQDGRKLRRYRKRWKIERFFAWLGAYRRLVVRWDRDPKIYSAFFQIACIMILVRRL
jgi:transposase